MMVKLPTIEKMREVMKWSDRIQKIVDNQDKYTRSDFQGAIEAVVMNIMNVKQEVLKEGVNI